MIPVLTAQQMRLADRRTIEGGVPGPTLMENAGRAVADAVRSRFPDARRPLVLCGKGNNGGDGFVAARHLGALRPRVALLGRRADVGGDARKKMKALEEAKEGEATVVEEVPDPAAWERFRPALGEADLIVDALLGTGLAERPRGLVGEAIEALASLSGVAIVSVDIPSGISSDTGLLAWPTVSRGPDRSRSGRRRWGTSCRPPATDAAPWWWPTSASPVTPSRGRRHRWP